MTILYAGGDTQLFVLRQEGPRFHEMQRALLGGLPSFLAGTSAQPHLYAVLEAADALAWLSINEDGTLREEGRIPCAGGPAHLALHPHAPWLFTASYGSGVVRVYPLGAEGSVSAPTCELFAGRWAHEAHFLPLRSELWVPCKGEDRVECYEFLVNSGELRHKFSLALPAGSGPRHITFDSQNRTAFLIGENDGHLYLLQELAGQWKIRQALRAFPSPARPGDSGAEVQLSAEERFVYVSLRGQDSLAVFSWQTESGLELVQHQSTHGQTPRHFCLPSPEELLCANQDSQSLSLFHRNPTTGQLRFVSEFSLPEKIYWIGPRP